MKLQSFQVRIRITSMLFLLVALFIITRLFFVQIIHQDEYREKADKQYATPSNNIFKRGSIFFSKKDGAVVTAATVSSGYKIAITPNKILNAEVVYEKLLPYLDIDQETFILRASKKNDPYEEIAHNLTKEQVTEIENMKLEGVSFFKDNWRFYPGEKMASHTLGFLAYKGDEKTGQYGLERTYEETLAVPKDEMNINFFAEVFSNIKYTISDKGQGDIITTIEPMVQSNLESELQEIFKKWKADEVGGIIINPQNGDIYAIAAEPSFDLNNYEKVNNTKIFRNPFVENVYEFGSIIKPLVVASALDAGVITPETTYFDKGNVTVDKKEIKNFDGEGRGLVNIQDILDQSLNTGMVFVESKLGHEKFRTYMKSFGIGEKTGIDLPNETHGLISNIDSPRNIEYANASFGQGIALTPIGAVRALSAIANGGKIITPHLVKEIKFENKIDQKIEYPTDDKLVIKPKTSETITRMLVHVFDNYNSGIHKLPHHTVASKTGTAQVAREDGKGYYEDRHMHSFFGYFPTDNPEFLVFLYVNNPKEGARYASQTLIPPFSDLTKFLLNYYSIAPDR
jgi:stage V sporulation protein D (sporulation-specific penicillin-binding protein)